MTESPPKADRPCVLDKARKSINRNELGTKEFLAWVHAVGAEPLMAVNLGTGTPEEAGALVEKALRAAKPILLPSSKGSAAQCGGPFAGGLAPIG